ncbi:MAG: hypothetical protein KJ573_13090 [Proteobacteria bacterium]|nr:hypothetical protein [Desulfobacterales bacterium]MBL6966856.1 hypothetical protein [Desulfobacteraceae bacterium]MBU0733487.1 hypothetical protein [Pseudomonadota bacterium]MBL7101915.1 hypothetical protein [Desulfobacteraceae bacterium]MBL7173036.1 hypothetical protein [Desulfobacteraceae bacterium]
MTGECYKKRFGTIAVEKGFITEEQLAEAIVMQVSDDMAGKEHRLIGTILFEQGYLNAKQVDVVLRAMEVCTKDPLGRVL